VEEDDFIIINGKLFKLKENKHGIKFLTYLEGTLSGGFFFLCKNAKKGPPILFFKYTSPSFFSCETYPPLEVSMGEKNERKKENFGRWFTSDTPPLLLLFFSFKKKETHFCLLETPEERELDKFCVHVLLLDWACHCTQKANAMVGKRIANWATSTLPQKVFTR
jgi:hypothetical protein